MIPRVIHYIWLGDKEMPATDKAFVEGWKRLLPDWEFRFWTLDSIKGIDNPFLRETLAARKWVFACDWLRLYALATEGGFYLDTDVELKSSLEPFRGHELCMGLNLSGYPQTALIGAVAHQPIIEELLGEYSGRKIIRGKGVYDETASNTIYQRLFLRHGVNLFKVSQTRPAEVLRGVCFYPSAVLCRPGEDPTTNVATHHAEGMWLDPYQRKCAVDLVAGLRFVRMKKRRIAQPGDRLNLLPEERVVMAVRLGRTVLTMVKVVVRSGSIGKALEAKFNAVRAAYGRFLVRKVWRKVVPRKVVFEQFHGNGFGCNMKYIALELMRRGGWELVWLANRPAEGEYPPGVRVVARKSRAALRELATAGFWCANHNLGHFVRHCGLVKKPHQHYLQTWHGSFGIKCCHDVTSPEERSMVDAVLTNGKFGTEHMRHCFGDGPEVLPTGYPRCDILHSCPSSIRDEVCRRLGLAPERKFVLYAPTFRDDGDRTAYLTDFEALTAALAKRFGGEWTVLLRLHPNLRKHNARLSFQGDAADVSTYEDIQELMVAADAMVSDYSSCIFDYILTRRPAFLYVPDRAKYEVVRGLRYSLDKTPFPISASPDGLADAVANFDAAVFAAAEERFLSWMESVERGNAAAQIADWFEDRLKARNM